MLKSISRVSKFLTSSNVKDNIGASKKKKRVGRGERSGKGKTSGRGQKGWHARASKDRPVPAFEGGQSSIIKSVPQFGSIHDRLHIFNHVALDSIQFAIRTNRIDPNKLVDIVAIRKSKLAKSTRKGIHLSSQGAQFLTHKLNIEVQSAHPDAIKRVEELGGTIKTVYYSPRDLKALMQPWLFSQLPTEKRGPTEWKDMKHYVDPERRGEYVPKDGESLADVVDRICNAKVRGSSV